MPVPLFQKQPFVNKLKKVLGMIQFVHKETQSWLLIFSKDLFGG